MTRASLFQTHDIMTKKNRDCHNEKTREDLYYLIQRKEPLNDKTQYVVRT